MRSMNLKTTLTATLFKYSLSLEHSFQQDFLISDLAAELDVSVNYLIKRFKEETGHTPRQFLLKNV